LFSHKSATVIANEIKHNLFNLEETLNQCSIESRATYGGTANEMKTQLEKLMVKNILFIFQINSLTFF
jgi:hypothetical protein